MARAIIVPYRDRAAVKPLNRGALKNIGFQLNEEHADQVCFHDVDYLAIWVDYFPVARPTALVWHRAEERLIAPAASNAKLLQNMESFFGGAVQSELVC